MKQTLRLVRSRPFRDRVRVAPRLQDAMARRYISAITFILAAMTGTAKANAQGATRDLSQFVGPTSTFTVTIAVNPPAGTSVVGVEEAPPSGWTVSVISNGGTFDAGTGKVKWGPFFDPAIPPLVSYDVTPPPGSVGYECFTGTVSFGGASAPNITGDTCVLVPVPAVTEWGMAIMALMMLCGATVLIGRPRVAAT